MNGLHFSSPFVGGAKVILVVGVEIECYRHASTVPPTNVIVIGASAGGFSPVRTLLNGFPKTIPAAVFVVIHTSPEGPGLLGQVLARATPLKVIAPDDGAIIRDGQLYVAPPDYHLVVDDRRVHLSHGPREHRFRPAIDPLFRTAARHFGARTIGIVLSGHMADGTHGLTLVKQAGGITMVQDPDEAEVPSMPLNAMRRVAVDYVLPVEEMPRVIMGWVNRSSSRRGSPAPRLKTERTTPEHARVDALRTGDLNGPPSPFTCPDCGGTLWEITERDLVRYRCHVGHGFAADSLREGIDTKIEESMWSAVRAIEEVIELRKRMLARAKRQNLSSFTDSLAEEIQELEGRADTLRSVLLAPTDSARVMKRARRHA